MIFMVLLGGLGTFEGPILGALVLFASSSSSRTRAAGTWSGSGWSRSWSRCCCRAGSGARSWTASASRLLPVGYHVGDDRPANELLAFAAERAPFQRERLDGLPLASSRSCAAARPARTSSLADQAAHPPYGTNLTFERGALPARAPDERDLRRDAAHPRHRRGLGVVAALLRRRVRAAGVGEGDRSRSPTRSARTSCSGRPTRVLERGGAWSPLGGMDSVQRLLAIRDYGATTLLATPTYALHLAQVAAQGDRLRRAGVRRHGSSARASRAPRSPACGTRSRRLGRPLLRPRRAHRGRRRSPTRAPLPAGCT